jgi:drug/metabolite transporter (DMT)-like permease
MKIETPTAKRLLGLLAGFIGVVMIVLVSDQVGTVNSWLWVILALLIPAVYAIEDLVISAKMPENWDIIAAVGIVSLVAVVLLVPIAYLFNDLVGLNIRPGKLELLMVLLALETLVGTALMVYLLRVSGAVFGSQVGYVATFAGIAWSIMLLHETLSLLAWSALGIMLVGLLLVEPTPEIEVRPELDLNKSNE